MEIIFTSMLKNVRMELLKIYKGGRFYMKNLNNLNKIQFYSVYNDLNDIF